MRTLPAAFAMALAVAACGDNLPAPPDAAVVPRLELVGHTPLGARGMNAALAVAGDTIYVGSRIDNRPVLIVDVADPRRPEVVGELGLPDEAQSGLSSRELRVLPDLELLIVLDLFCSPDLHGCTGITGGREGLRLYDIHDRRAPRRLAEYPIAGDFRHLRSPHELYLWRDPARPARVLAYVTTPPGADSLEVVDLSDRSAPRKLLAWDVVDDGGLSPLGSDNILHSISVSDDGRTAYASHQQGGLVVLDTADLADDRPSPTIRMLTPPAMALDWSPPGAIGPHSAVLVPGRPLAVVTEEVYPPPFGRGCPWGWARIVDVSQPAALRVVGEYRAAENAAAYCTGGAPLDRVTFTAHNVTATAHLAFISWYAAGLQVVDVTDPAHPAGVVDFRPEPLGAVTTEDPGVGGAPVAMWSYPVIEDGLVYVVDLRNGLYILRYHGPYQDEVSATGFAEGNSNRGR